MTDRAAASPGRFGQLTYSSFDAGTGNAGWQVKEATGDVTPRERDLITARIATRLDVGPMATFPTPEEIERLPRRLVYGSFPDGSAAYWHTAVAGMDASGRPGNVFVHVLLDRHPGSADDLRPIDLWRSPDWLTPFNPEQVVVAAIPAGPRPRPGAATGSTQAVGFLLDPSRWRIGVLTGLLDAVAAAMDGGLPVVLGVADIEDAARWLAAVSHLMSPGTARRLFFSTHERADTVRAAADAGMHVVCVPREDLPALPRDLAAVVIDDVETIQMGTIDGEPHETEHGSRIEVTPWSGIVQVVAAERDPAIALLAEADAVASAVGDVDLSPAWPLAATALRHPDTLREAQNDAARAVLTSSPPLDGHPELHAALARGVRSAVGADARQAWVHLEHVGSGHWSAVAGIVLDVYVQRVLDDVGWLTQPGHAPVPDLSGTVPLHLDPAVVLERVRAISERVAAPGREPSVPLAVEVVRLADFLVRARVMEGLGRRDPGAAAWGAIEAELRRLVVPVCLDPGAAGAFTTAAGTVDAAVVLRVQELLSLELASQVQRGTAPPLGERVPSATLRWLFNGPLELVPVGIADEIEKWSAADLVMAELPVQEFLAAPQSGAARASLVVALEEFERQRGVSGRLDIAALVAAAALDLDELAAVVARYGKFVPPAVLVPALKSEPYSAALRQICMQLAPEAWRDGLRWSCPAQPDEVESLVRLRSTVRAMWWECMGNEVERTTVARDLLHHAMRAFVDAAPDVPLQPEVLAHAQAAWLYLMLTHEGLYGSERQDDLLSHVSSGAAALDLATVTGAIFGPARALAYGALTAPHSPLSARGVSIAATALLRAEVDGRTEPVLDLVVRRYLARPEIDPAALLDAALAASSEWVPGEAERGLDSWRKYLEQRIKHLGGRSGVINATLGRFRRA